MKKTLICIGGLLLCIALGAFLVISIKTHKHPTSTYILDRQTRQIAVTDVHGYELYFDSCAVKEDGKYNIHLVPISQVTERETIAYTFNGWVMEYGMVASITTDANGDEVLLIPTQNADEYISVTVAEFRGIVESKD